MGVPKRLTEMQQKFAHLLVTNEGRMTAYECAKEAGYSEDRARQTASELQNPKKYPLVVAYIGEIREENNYFQIDTDNDFDKSEKYDFKVRFFEDPERKFKVIFLKTFNFSNYLKLHNYVEDAVSYSIYSYVERETGRHED